ncbi:MAG: RNA polymerase factor sigma-54 [Bdellovibrionales bacterium]|nr:RNA polymerase factor sigma-54 [Bdellovibrionales bacterium]
MKLTQSLRMTPQLQQAIKLLQLSRLELENEVRKELIENPVLEESMDQADLEPGKSEERTNQSEEASMAGEFDKLAGMDQDPRKQEEFDWDNYMESNYKSTTGSMGGGEEVINYENIISSEQTLSDHLTWQMNMSGFDEEETYLGSILISYIEDDGYIKVPLEEIAESEDISLSDLEETLPLIQVFDPPGVGARDLKECLLIQAKYLEEDTHDLVHIINNHLKDLEKKNYRAIAKEMNLELEDVIELCKIILSMEPKPGRAFVTSDTNYITPDVYVYKVGDEYMVSLNEDGLPKLRISNLYKNLLNEEKDRVSKGEDGKKEDQAQKYIQEKLKSAVWLIKSIHQRQRTIYKVTESIVKHQTDFFDKGPGYIKPMILRDVANDIGMHESTVSRVTTNKYVNTPQGIFELKYFFNSGISKTDGDSLASESVKLKIKDLIGAEDPKKPLSDQKIVELLKKDDIKIARRTVAKYRDMLKILPSSKRKKYF